MVISLIVPTYRSAPSLRRYLETLVRHNRTDDVFVTIVEVSEDTQIEAVVSSFRGRLRLQLIYSENRGYGAACNIGYGASPVSDVYIFSNPDIMFTSALLDAVRERFSPECYGSVVQRLRSGRCYTVDLYPQYKTFLTEVLRLHRLINLVGWSDSRFTYVVGAFLIVGRQVLERCGAFDERFFLYYEEVDFCYRARRCGRLVIVDDHCIVHETNQSISQNESIDRHTIQLESLLAYCEKYGNFRYLRSLRLLYRMRGLFSQEQASKGRLAVEILRRSRRASAGNCVRH